MLAASMMTALVPAAVALDGGQEGVNTQNSGQSDSLGPDRAGLKWSELIADRGQNLPRNGALQFDSVGHVLAQANYRDGTNTVHEVLIALDRADGTFAWEADGVEVSCDVAAGDHGVIYAHEQAPGGAISVIAIDAETGDEITAKRYTAPETTEQPRVNACDDGLTLLADGTLLWVESGGFEVQALDTTTSPMTHLWATSRTRGEWVGRLPASLDESVVYLAWTDTATPRTLHVDALDVETGATVDTGTVPGDRIEPASGQGDTFFVDADGGLVIASNDAATNQAHITRLNPDLTQDWSKAIAADDPVYGSSGGFA